MDPPPQFQFGLSVQENAAIFATWQAKKFFSQDPNVQCERLSSGERTTTLLLRVRQSNITFRRYVMKKALVDDPGVLQSEVQVLQGLENSPHIVTLVSLDSKPYLNPFGPAALQGDHYIMEYLQNGTLQQFIDRTDALERLPNRLIIAIFLCAVRACAGMSYPPGPNRDRFGYLPMEGADENQDPSNLAHGALFPSHFVFGDSDHRQDHALIPSMKLISFGAARLVNQYRPVDIDEVEDFDKKLGIVRAAAPYGRHSPAASSNVLGIGVLMANIINEDFMGSAEETRESLLEGMNPGYDRDLYNLAAQCIAADPANRPTIHELIEILYNKWLWDKRAGYYQGTGGADIETDAAIRGLVQEYIYDAGT